MIEEALRFYNSTVAETPLFYAVYFSFVSSIGYIVGGITRQYIISTVYLVLFIILFGDITTNLPALKSVYLFPAYAIFFLAGLNCRLNFLSLVSFPSFGFIASISEALRGSLASFRVSRQANTRTQGKKRSQGHSGAKRKQDESGQSEARKQKAREEFKRARAERESENQEGGQAQAKPTRSPLDVLGLSQGYSPAELEKAYKTLRGRYHPDRFEHMSDALKAEMAEEFIAVQKSYKFLK